MQTFPDWITRGKTVRQLIQELQSFENQDLEVQISIDGGENSKCISLVKKSNGMAVLVNYESNEYADPNWNGAAFAHEALCQ